MTSRQNGGSSHRLGHAGAGAGDRWMLGAACLNADSELFFPDLLGAIGIDRIRQAKEFCAGCLVRAKCLDWALGAGEVYGIWGGMTPDERRALRVRRRPPTTLRRP